MSQLFLAAAVLLLPFMGNSVVREQVLQRVLSSWFLVAVAERQAAAEPGFDEADFHDILLDEEVGAPVVPPARAAVVERHPPLGLMVMPDGAVKDGEGNLLANDEAVLAYLRKGKEALDDGEEPRLHLRVSAEVPFANVRRVIGLAAREEVDEVVFLQVPGPGGREGDVPDGVDPELHAPQEAGDLQLPEVAPRDKPPGLPPFFIKIDAKGHLHVNRGAAAEALDADAEEGQLPLLAQRLKAYVAAAELRGEEPAVQIYAEPDARQARVLEVLDVLRRQGIEKLTLTDLVEAE